MTRVTDKWNDSPYLLVTEDTVRREERTKTRLPMDILTDDPGNLVTASGVHRRKEPLVPIEGKTRTV